MLKKYFSEAWDLTKFTFRKERLSSAIWLLVIISLSLFVTVAYRNLFADEGSLMEMLGVLNNPAMVTLFGPVFDTTEAGIYGATMLVFLVLIIGIMNIFLVIRNTRSEEEKGRYEVIRSLPVGRLSGLTATLTFATIVNFIIFIVVGFGLAICGYPFDGSILYGLALFAGGMFFAAIAAVFAQLCSSAKSAITYSLVTMGLLYIIRGFGDAADGSFLSYISPLGMLIQAQIYAANYWLLVVAVIAITAALIALAFKLNTIRDIGRGFMAEKPGRSTGSFLMKSHSGLMFKLTRNMIIGFFITLVVFGAMYGSIMGDMESFLSSGMFGDILASIIPEGTNVVEGFISMLVNVLVVMAAIPAIMAILKLVGEEKNHRYEMIISCAVSKNTLMTNHLVYALLQSVVMVFGAMIGLWIAAAAVMPNPISFVSMLSTFAVYIPAVWVFIGLAALLIGLLPKHASLIVWGYLGITFYVVYIGQLLNLPESVSYLTPLGYVPSLPLETYSIWGTLGLTTVAIVLAVIGYITYKRRDHKNML